MAAPFAALESRINAAALTKLANAVVMRGAETASGVFDGPAREIFNGMVHTTEPTLVLAEDALPGLARGQVLNIDGDDYEVREVLDPDAGYVTATLRKA